MQSHASAQGNAGAKSRPKCQIVGAGLAAEQELLPGRKARARPALGIGQVLALQVGEHLRLQNRHLAFVLHGVLPFRGISVPLSRPS